MKKLVKLLLVVGMLFMAITVTGSTIFAEGSEEPNPVQTENIPTNESVETTTVEDKENIVVVDGKDNEPDVVVVEEGKIEKEIESPSEQVDIKPESAEGSDKIPVVEIVTDENDPKNKKDDESTIVIDPITTDPESEIPTGEDLKDVTIITETPTGESTQEINRGKLEIDPKDLLIEIDPKFAEEVSGVSATAVDYETLTKKIIDGHDWKKIFGLGDRDVIKLTVDDSEENKGKWTIKTPSIDYEIKKKTEIKFVGYNKLGWPKYETETSYYVEVPKGSDNDYDVIYLHVSTQKMQIDEGMLDEDDGLDIPDVEITVPEGKTSEEVTIFDANNIPGYVADSNIVDYVGKPVNKYDATYEEGGTAYYKNITGLHESSLNTDEGLTIENIKVKNILDDEGVTSEGLTVTVYDDGKVTVLANKKGTYDVFLEGWYTERKYESIKITPLYDDLYLYQKGTHYRKIDNEIYKIVTDNRGNRSWSILKEHSAWATFADVKVTAVLASTDTPIYINEYDGSDDVNGKREWLVIKETDQPVEPKIDDYGGDIDAYNEALEEYKNTDVYQIKTEIENTLGEKSEETFFFDIDLYEQMYLNGVAQGKAEKIGDVGGNNGEEKTLVSLTVTLTKEIAEGKRPEFTVLFKHGDMNVVTIEPEDVINNGDGTWTIKFRSGLFSTYAVTYEVVDIPQPQPQPKKHSNGFRVVHTGVDEGPQNTNTANGYNFSLVALLGLATLIALKKKNAVR